MNAVYKYIFAVYLFGNVFLYMSKWVHEYTHTSTQHTHTHTRTNTTHTYTHTYMHVRVRAHTHTHTNTTCPTISEVGTHGFAAKKIVKQSGRYSI